MFESARRLSPRRLFLVLALAAAAAGSAVVAGGHAANVAGPVDSASATDASATAFVSSVNRNFEYGRTWS